MRQWVLGVALVGALAAAHAQGQDPTVTVAVTAPANGTVTEAPAHIALAATASVNRQNWAILRVEFYSGTDLIGAATSAPYTLTWSGVAAGNYTVSAKAIATNPGQAKQDPATHPNMPTWQGVSAPVAIRVDAPPTVALTAPANHTVLAAPASIALSASAADAVGTLTKVDFYQGSTLIGTASAAPYTVNWNNVPAGTYSLTAVATNDAGGATTSSPIALRVDSPPTVSLTAPANNAVFAAPANVALNAAAADAVGTLTKVDFYQGGTLLGTATVAPYTFNWSSVPAGTYTLTAVATNDAGMATTSSPVALRVDSPPTVVLTSPANNAVLQAPGNVTLAATAADAVGAITKVDFYQGGTMIGTATAAPYTFNWSSVPAGTYTLTAVATNDAGMTTTSAPVTVNVASARAAVYYIQVDHLNTPRVITNQQGTIVWRWDNTDPFGGNVPDENPSGLGTFQFPLRYPGTYADRETGLLQNYFRDLDPNIGRYVESDPIGLRGGVNTYTYAYSSPLRYFDSSGLRVVLVGHLAAGPLGRITNPNSYHLALYLDPDDKCKCSGNWPMTLGAQRIGGKLVGTFNYPGDALKNATFQQVVPTPPGMTDCDFIRELISTAASYPSNLPYSIPDISVVPGATDGVMGPGQYNSNSFASGVLQGAGAIPPTINSGSTFQTPGYSNPIPIQR